MHKLGKRKASEVDFWRFLIISGVPREDQKCTKIKKNAFQKSIEKKEAKKEAIPPVRGEGRRRLRGQKECKIPAQEGFCNDFGGGFTHATTPGGVRRILFACAIPADPWD